MSLPAPETTLPFETTLNTTNSHKCANDMCIARLPQLCACACGARWCETCRKSHTTFVGTAHQSGGRICVSPACLQLALRSLRVRCANDRLSCAVAWMRASMDCAQGVYADTFGSCTSLARLEGVIRDDTPAALRAGDNFDLSALAI